MRFRELAGQFLEDLRAQRARTMLTVFGITWGTVAVIVLLAFGTGLSAQMQKNAAGIGEGIVILSGGRTTVTHQGFPAGRPIRLAEEDAALLGSEIPDIAAISPEYGLWQAVAYEDRAANPYITGVLPVYGGLRSIHVREGGRFLNELDVERRRRVAVLGNGLDSLLFAGADAIGREIRIGGVPFLVVGVMAPKTQNSSYAARDQDRVFIPASTHRAVFGQPGVRHIIYRTTDPELTRSVQARVYELLGRRYTFDPGDDDALNVWDTNEGLRMFKYLFLGFNLFLGVVGSFTLTVGGIGVANIMYVVVRERTREIGIKRSLGARRRDILGQFLAETFVIVGSGALLGFIVSSVVVMGVRMLPIEEYVGTPVVSPAVAAATIVLLAVIALLAGLFPARRAANLDPVECLRHGS
jgi:putative ABC transport system permease protein